MLSISGFLSPGQSWSHGVDGLVEPVLCVDEPGGVVRAQALNCHLPDRVVGNPARASLGALLPRQGSSGDGLDLWLTARSPWQWRESTGHELPARVDPGHVVTPSFTRCPTGRAQPPRCLSGRTNRPRGGPAERGPAGRAVDCPSVGAPPVGPLSARRRVSWMSPSGTCHADAHGLAPGAGRSPVGDTGGTPTVASTRSQP